MNEQFLIVACAFGCVTLFGYFLSRLLMGSADGKLRSRLNGEAADDRASPSSGAGTVMPLIRKMGQAAAEPFMPKTREKQSGLRKKLGYAGIYSSSAITFVTAAKVIMLLAGLGGGYAAGLMTGQMLLAVSAGGLLGYLAPTLWLKLKISGNQKELTYGLADALDLMVVCVEAGLTVDGAMQRVGQELALAHPALSRELGIAHMETRVGLSRGESMKNLGLRTGNAAIQSLAAMLIQADRFGTSIANALRIHADSLRNARQHIAEELAAKASVKMSFPLVLFIFPATFIVLAGPTVIGLMNSEFMK